jgi:hypothetical protein
MSIPIISPSATCSDALHAAIRSVQISNTERPMYVCMLLSDADRLCWAAPGLNAAALNIREFLKNGASQTDTFVMSLNEVTRNCARQRQRRERALWESACEARRHTVWTVLDPEFMNKILDFCAVVMALV